MKWLDRVRKTENTPGDDLTKLTEVALVSFVSASGAPIRDFETVNDPEFSAEPLPPVNPLSDRHMARVVLFASRGLRNHDAERLALEVGARLRDFDDRRICLECRKLSGNRCSVPALAGAGAFVTPLLRLPQRCLGFEAAA